MKTTWMQSGVLAAVTLFAGSVSAQTVVVSSPGESYGYGGYGHSGYRHASTYEEGVLRGYADLHRAHGESAYWHSLAAINRQQAKASYIRNRELATETYFRMQQINRAAREAKRPARLAPEQYAMIAHQQAPDRLDGQQYDRTLGRLNWPAVLTSDLFSAEREALNAAFAGRTHTDFGAGSAFHDHARSLSSVMQAKLHSQMGAMDQMAYLAAKKFLQSLAYEAQQPLVVEALAAAE
jgi:hypothetical protein